MTETAPGHGLTFVTSIFGCRHLPFLAPHLERIREVEPAADALVLWDDLPTAEVRLLEGAFPEYRFHEQALGVAGDSHRRIARKLHFWRAAGAKISSPRICFLDTDALLTRPIDHLILDPESDLVVTWKDEPWPINVGVVGLKTDLANEFVGLWLETVEKILADDRALAEARAMSGAADQHALRQLIGFANYDGLRERRLGGRTWRVRGVPCRLLNETNCRPLDDEIHVVHYKGGWHRILLDGSGFTESRPAAACGPMLDFWHDTRRAAEQALASRFVRRAAERHEEVFKAECGPFEERGILHTEMLAACSAMAELGVDLILESGRARGQSTRVLADFFRDREVRIVSVERTRDADAEFAEERLAGEPHVELLYGDSLEVLPRCVKEARARRVALLLDGPKGQVAVDLIRRCLAVDKRVVLACLHDAKKGFPGRQAVESTFARAFFTDDPEYVERFGELDEPCRTRDDQVGPHSWRPYFKGHEPMESYGPTLAVVFPTLAERASAASETRGRERPWREVSRRLLRDPRRLLRVPRRFLRALGV